MGREQTNPTGLGTDSSGACISTLHDGYDDDDDDDDNNNSIQFNSLLFMCRANSHKANYRHSTV
jgi:hypothetical protein